MNEDRSENKTQRRPLFQRTYQKRSLGRWVVPLIIILAVIFFLPRLMEILIPQY